MALKGTFSPRTAFAVVVANMIGTGVFTSLGFQLLDIQSGFVILLLWVIGGLTAVSGALCYAELGGAYPRSGGEYNFLGRLYHPMAGFVSGWVSSTVGFAAPTALVAMTFGSYLGSSFPSLPAMPLAVGLIVAATIAHIASRRISGSFQSTFTMIKIGVIVVFVVAVFLMTPNPASVDWLPAAGDLGVVGTGAFAVALIYVNYAYTGWNAATYVLDELEDPGTLLVRVLLSGTAVVMVLYLALNAAFLYAAPMDAMAGKIEIGVIAARYAFGDIGASLMGATLGVLLISTVSAMTLAGPRVLQVVGQDHSVLAVFARTTGDGLPMNAILFQSTLAVLLVVSGTFQSVLLFASFTLALNTVMTVMGVFVRRARGVPSSFQMPWFPLAPVWFLGVMLWTLFYVFLEQPLEAVAAIGFVASGALIYFVSRDRSSLPSPAEPNERSKGESA